MIWEFGDLEFFRIRYFKQVRNYILRGISFNISMGAIRYSVHTTVAQGIDYGDKPFRKPWNEFKRHASHVQGLHGLLRPAEVGDVGDDVVDVDDDDDDDDGQGLRRRRPAVSNKILFFHLWQRFHLYSRFSAKIIVLLVWVGTIIVVYNVEIVKLCSIVKKVIKANWSEWSHVDCGEEKLLLWLPLFWPWGFTQHENQHHHAFLSY